MDNGTQRIEAFSDGVFAIAITLLVLDIRLPPTSDAAAFSLANALVRLWPQLFAFVLSFLMIGIYWANHHYLLKLFRKTDHQFNLLNLLFLLCISIVPFPTSVLGQYWTDVSQRRTAVALYAIGMMLPAVAWCLKWMYASRGLRLLDPRLDENFVAALSRQYLWSVLLYAIGAIAAFIHPHASLAICVALTLLYLRTPMAPVLRAEESP